MSSVDVTEPGTAVDKPVPAVPPKAKRGLKIGRLARNFLPPVILFVALLALWQYLVGALNVQPYILPKPTSIASEMWTSRGILLQNGWVTLKEVLGGFGVALVVGVVLATLMAESGLMRRTIYPLIVTSQTVPIIAIAPLITIWFGFGLASKVYVAAIIAFFPITVNTTTGLGVLEQDLGRLMRSFPANRWQIFTKAKIPAALPLFFAGIKIGMVLAVIGAVVGEFVGADSGLGSYIVQQNAALNTDAVFAAVASLSIMGIVLFLIISVIERVSIPWYYEERDAAA